MRVSKRRDGMIFDALQILMKSFSFAKLGSYKPVSIEDKKEWCWEKERKKEQER